MGVRVPPPVLAFCQKLRKETIARTAGVCFPALAAVRQISDSYSFLFRRLNKNYVQFQIRDDSLLS